MRNIVLGIAFVVAVMLPGVSYAQLDAASLARAQRGQGMNQGMGANGLIDPNANGMDQMEGSEGEAADSTDTGRKKRPRRALESYYFSSR